MATAPRAAAFYRPDDDRGKWHAMARVTQTAFCGSAAPMPEAGPGADRIVVVVGQDLVTVHPIVCRRCLRLAMSPAGTGTVL